jgi:uncharacterized protein with FMN-binding domain
MRRGILAIVGTVAGTALMLGAKLGTAPPADPAAALADDGGTPPAEGPSGASTAPAPSTSVTPAASASGPAGRTPGPGTRTTPPPTTKPPGGLKDGTYTGADTTVRRYNYTLTVSITVSGGRISAGNVDCGSATGVSKTICTGRGPKLVQETLAAQSADVATVSGATYTSAAYTVSLQSAIDKARA